MSQGLDFGFFLLQLLLILKDFDFSVIKLVRDTFRLKFELG